MVIARILNEGIRLGSRYFKQLHKYDVSIHKGLYGASGGRGVRHGRDAGIFISQYIQGDDLDQHAVQEQPRYGTPSGKQRQAYNRNKRRDSRRSTKCYPSSFRRKQSRSYY